MSQKTEIASVGAKEAPKRGTAPNGATGDAATWVSAGLRVRVVDKRVDSGRLFESKVDVLQMLRAETG